jgi:radical SAM superfamily enzyme YgiQ (UPF0313 family)
MLKIVLILAGDNTYHYRGAFSKSISYAPLTLTTLAALVPGTIDADIQLIDEGVQPAGYDKLHADIVGISCVTSSSVRARQIAGYWRSRGAHTVIGGVHVTLNPLEMEGVADTLICGPAEETWPRFLQDFIEGRPGNFYSSRSVPAETIPVPARQLLPRKSYLSVPTVIADRGCLNSCAFCSINRLWDCRESARVVPDVIEEIIALKSRRILFLDPNLTADREYALELFEALIPLRIEWAGLSSIDVTRDKSMFSLMVKSGCRGILVGFESMDQVALDQYQKSSNNVTFYREAVDMFHRHEIPVLGTFMLGFENDTVESIEKMVSMIDDSGIDFPRFSVMTPFPGTDPYDWYQGDGRVLTRDWSLYDTEHVVFTPARMTPIQLQTSLVRTWKMIYSPSRILKRLTMLKRYHLLAFMVNIGFHRYVSTLRKRISWGSSHFQKMTGA